MQSEVRSEITLEDHYALNRYAALHTGMYRHSLLGTLLAGVILLVVWAQTLVTPSVGPLLHRMLGVRWPVDLLLLLAFGFLGWMLGKPFFLWNLKQITRNQAGTDTSIIGKQVLSLGTQGLMVTAGGSESRTSWTAISDVEEDAEHFYFFLGPRRAYILPKRDLGQDGESPEFLAAAKAYWAAVDHSAVSIQTKPRRCIGCGVGIATGEYCPECAAALQESAATDPLVQHGLAQSKGSHVSYRLLMAVVAASAFIAAFVTIFDPGRR